jgi:two-component system NtrC family sensor kinase
MIPVHGRKAPIGTLALGSRRKLSYAPDELEFLTTTAQQVGMAFENMKLVEQVLRSHRQWANTFDSIQDVVLVHDAEYRVMRAKPSATGTPRPASAADIAGETCTKVLPHAHEWALCPYCPAADGEMDSTKGETSASAARRWSRHPPTSIRTHQCRREPSTSFATLPSAAWRRKNTSCCSSRCRKACLPRLLMANCSIATMLWFVCSDYNSRSELMGLNVDTELYSSPERREAFRREVEEHNYVRNFEVLPPHEKMALLLAALESSFATRGADGKIERYQGFLLDITEKEACRR